MKRRRHNITLYNNVYSQHKPPAHKTLLHHNPQRALLCLNVYQYVFTAKVAFAASLLVTISLLLQPVAFVYADESDPDTTEATSATEVTETVVETELESTDTEQAADVSDSVFETASDEEEVDETPENIPSDITEEISDANVEQPSQQTSTATTTETASTTSAADESRDVIPVDLVAATSQATTTTAQPVATTSTATSSPDTTSTSSTTTVNTAPGGGAEVTDTASSSDESSVAGDSSDSEEDVAASAASSTVTTSATSSVATTTTQTSDAVSTTQTDNVFAFNKNECTEVEDGSFYCQKISSDTMTDNDLFAAPDATGDMEIYVIQNGEQIKVTDNAVDDASPYYDARSKTIVWHRLVNDRYQIISFDIESQAETQLTDTAVNNMEPTKNGEYIVWQRWVQNNWEIILLDGDDEVQITDSIEHDIAPHIRGELIIWNVRSSDGSQSLMTYDIASQAFNEIKDTDGVSVTNPRMLVMYEAQYQNGDTVMKGFDLVTGEIIPIERIPRDLPTDIPSPEATGEVRALPTNPQSEEELASDSNLDTDEPTDTATTSMQYREDDLVLNATTTATSTPTVETIDFDLDLRQTDSQLATTTDGTVIDQAAIPDVVVPEYDQKDVVEQATSTQQN